MINTPSTGGKGVRSSSILPGKSVRTRKGETYDLLQLTCIDGEHPFLVPFLPTPKESPAFSNPLLTLSPTSMPHLDPRTFPAVQDHYSQEINTLDNFTQPSKIRGWMPAHRASGNRKHKEGREEHMRRRFFKTRRHRIPYGVIMGAAILALALVFYMVFRFLIPVCQG